MGMTYWGVTSLKFVTGTHKLAQKYINLKTKRAYTGVGSNEFNDCLQQHLRRQETVSASWQEGREVASTARQCSSS